MADIHIRKDGRAGRVTLTRAASLNALSYEMCLALDAALRRWAVEDDVALVVIDAEGARAFCAGGDIVEMYQTGEAGDFAYGQRFWRDEYRMNARIAECPKPVVTLMQGFTMGGGVGVGCHASHRVVGESSQIAMPECAIGIVPDVGGSAILARAPGRLGAYLGVTGARMGPGDAIHAGFADLFVPEAGWPALIAALVETGDCGVLAKAAQPAPEAPLAARQAEIDAFFASDSLAGIVEALMADGGHFAADALKRITRNSPLAMACAVEILHRLGDAPTVRAALAMEYRFTFRASEQSDFLEGIRAAVIDKDRAPRWKHAAPGAVPAAQVAAMLAPVRDADMGDLAPLFDGGQTDADL